jgi:hypothetical protein
MDVIQNENATFVEIETRGQARKRKNRERNKAIRSINRSNKDIEREREKELRKEREKELRKERKKELRNERKRLDEERRAAEQAEKNRANVRERQRANRMEDRLAQATLDNARYMQALEACVPLRVLEMNEQFELTAQRYANWPELVAPETSIRALEKFRNLTLLDELRELPCAVCSGLHKKDDCTQTPLKNVDLSLLQPPNLLKSAAFDINFNYEHPDIDATGLMVLLDRDGFIYAQSSTSESESLNDSNSPAIDATPSDACNGNPFDLRVCTTCDNYLKQKKTPPLSLANMWIGPTPACLRDLTIPEQLLISPGYLCMNLVQMSEKRHSHHKLKGHIVTLPQDPSSLTKILPLPMYKLCEHLKVVFVGQGAPTTQQLKRVLQVRKSKVEMALRWLIIHNVLFKKNNIQIDEEALQTLPEGDIPDALKVTITAVDIDPLKVEHYTGYANDPLEKGADHPDDDDNSEEDDSNDNAERSTQELRASGILHVDNVPITGKENTLLSLYNIINNSESQSVDATSNDANTAASEPRTIRMPHLNTPLNDYTDHDYFPAGYPTLFPYGVGGHMDKHRLYPISLKKYAKHLMCHGDPKFRQHRSLRFVLFNTLQRREAALMTHIAAKASNFARSAELVATLTPNDISLSLDQERNKQPISNPAVAELVKNVNAIGSKLMASNQSRSRMRNEMRAIIIRDGTPSLFVTINPADLHSPIVMMYAGEEIDLDNILQDNFPKTTERSRLAHLDPSAVAKYFDVVIKCILDTIVGYGEENVGVFGPVKNYYGTVEYQDRGTPHCHMLIWLHGAPDPVSLRQRIKEDELFCEKLLRYVSSIVREDVSYLLQEGEVLTDEMLRAEYMSPKTIEEKRRHPSFFPIPDPSSPNFEEDFRKDLLSIAKRTLFHFCSKTCKKYNRGTQRNCRFDFPRELVDPPGNIFVDQGIIAIQRCNAMINNHNPYITAACRGNNDIKFISARKHALAYIYYITDYITKSDVPINNSFLTCAATLESYFEKASNITTVGYVDTSRKLVLKCLNKMAGQMELTSPQVSAYLLNINDHYTPCKFASLYIEAFESYLSKELERHRSEAYGDHHPAGDQDTTSMLTLMCSNDENSLYSATESFLINSSEEQLMPVNRRVDYQFRGNSLTGMCLYDYTATINKIKFDFHKFATPLEQISDQERTRFNRFPFSGGERMQCNEECDHASMHPQHATHIQFHCKRGNEKVVVLSGRIVPKKDDQAQAERYALCILLLFKPWNHVLDLIGNHATWPEACREFLESETLSPRLRYIIDNIELLHRCSEESALERELRQAAKDEPESARIQRIDRSSSAYDAAEDDLVSSLLDDQEIQFDGSNVSLTEGDSGFCPLSIIKCGLKDPDGVEMALLPLRLRGRFDPDLGISTHPTTRFQYQPDRNDDENMELPITISSNNDDVRPSTDSDENLLKTWRSTITNRKSQTQNAEEEEDDEGMDVELPQAHIIESLDETNINIEESASLNAAIMEEDCDTLALEKFSAGLNDEQKRAYFLVCDHRRRNYPENQEKPTQLLLYLSGAGGTGKTRVIRAICDYFESVGKRDTLLLLAPTGIAASNISGNTIHSVCGLTFGNDTYGNKRNCDALNATAQQRLEDRWANIEYVIMDEISMIGQRLLVKFHACVQKAKAINDTTLPFAGLHILFAGDFLQLPPVQDPPLYEPNKITRLATAAHQTEPATTHQEVPPKTTTSKRNRSANVSSITSTTAVNAIGRDLWLSVKNVVHLKKPMRQIGDATYAALLENMRDGKLTQEQREILRSRIIGDDQVAMREWRQAVFIVTKNDERVQLNLEAAKEHAHDLQQIIYYSCAEDTYQRHPLHGRRRLHFLSASDTKENSLCGILPLTIGMKATITVNICIKDGLANGTEGIIRQIIYEKDSVNYMHLQEENAYNNAVELGKVPKYVVMELTDRTPGHYEGLPPNHIPIYPIKLTCTHTIRSRDGSKIQHRFKRYQLPITPAFAFTDFKCQGRTLKKGIVDISGARASTSAYVMLSRVQNLNDLLILRPYNESVLNMKISPGLQAELNRLKKCAQDTEELQRWP